MSKTSIIGVIAVVFFCTPIYAQQTGQADQQVIEEQGQEPVPAGQVVEPQRQETTALNELAEGVVSLDFRDADIQDILRVLSYKSGVNIVAGPEVTGLVTIQLENVPWQRALDVVVQTYGYAYDRRDNIITVTTVENLKKRREDEMVLSEQEPLVTRAFVLNYAKASSVIESVEKMRTERGSINYDERTNSIIVRDTVSNVEMIGEIVKKLDATTPQVLIESRIVETTLGDTEKLGINWNLQASGTGSVWNSTFPIRDGNNGNFVQPVPVESIDATTGLITYDATNNFAYGTLNFSQFTALMQVIETRSDTNTLSNPRVVTLDNQPAKIVVGTQYPFPEYTYNEDQGQMQVSGWYYKDIGVIFEVTPHVNNAGMVTLDLKPTVTAIISGSNVTVEGTTVPTLTTREANTSVMIKDGETLVIGGLISDTQTDTESKVPILGDIPFLGRLFRHTSKIGSKTDLLIFITPHIITSESITEE